MADYFVSDTDGDNGDSGLTEALAWKTVAKVNGATFSAGDTISFNKGDTWNETLIPPDSGTAGNPITFQAYGSGANPAMIGSVAAGGASALVNACKVDTKDWVSFDSIDFLGSRGSTNGDHVVRIEDADNITLSNLAIDGAADNDPGGINIAALTFLGTADSPVVTNVTITGGISNQVRWFGSGGNGTFTNCTFTQATGAVDGWGYLSGVVIQNVSGNNHTFDGCTWLGPTPSSQQMLDFKAGTGHLVKNCTFTPDNQVAEHLSITSGDASGTQTVAIVQDCTFNNASAGVDDETTGTFRRCKFVQKVNGIGRQIKTGSTATRGDSTIAIFEDCSFELESGIDVDELFELRRGSVTIDNCTAVMRNGAGSGVHIIDMSSTFAGSLTVRNSILTGDIVLINEAAGSTATFSFLNNLFERTDQATGWFSFDTETTCADEDDVGATAPLNDSSNVTGDPVFVTEDETADLYLRVDPVNSPAVGAGSDSFGGSTDLKGIPYGSPKNIGCRASSIRHKHHHLRQMMAI